MTSNAASLLQVFKYDGTLLAREKRDVLLEARWLPAAPGALLAWRMCVLSLMLLRRSLPAAPLLRVRRVGEQAGRQLLQVVKPLAPGCVHGCRYI